MSPEDISVIVKQPPRTTVVEIEDKLKLKPSDIKLSSAMAMSAAAVSPYLGKEEELEREFTHILTVCGIEMAANIVYDMKGEIDEHWCGRLWLYFINLIVMVSISVGGVFLVLEMLAPSFPISSLPVVTAIFVVGGILLVLAGLVLFCMLFPWPSCCSRWCVVHLPIYRFVRSILNIVTHSKTLPAMLHLSDGGHFETYGLLPLLKLGLPKILIVDGSEINSNDDYDRKIIEAMEHARELLDCSFTSVKGNGDVLTDIKNAYVKPKDDKFPRRYEFKVHYDADKTGDIVLIAPRPPNTPEGFGQGVTSMSGDNSAVVDDPKDIRMPKIPEGSTGIYPGWDNPRCEGRSLGNDWGTGPYLTLQDVNEIEGCPGGLGCCDCCATTCCQCGSCFPFPRHPTLSQFFTPRIFTAYHREGYRACMECDDFLKDIGSKN